MCIYYKSTFYLYTVWLVGSSSAEGLFQDEPSEVMPTGRVVGVLQRNWRDYVASFAENEVNLL